jgi:hypothetical protein
MHQYRLKSVAWCSIVALVLAQFFCIATPSRAEGISAVGKVGPSQQVLYAGSADFVLASPCIWGGAGCSPTGDPAVPAGTVLLACMWNFYRGFPPIPGIPCPNPSPTPVPGVGVPLPITPPAGWIPLDHVEQRDPYGNPDGSNTPGGYDEFYLFYKIADGSEGGSYDFTTAYCPEDQAGVVVGFSGVNLSAPFDPSKGAGGHSFSCSDPSGFNPACPFPVYNPVTIPGLTTESANDLLWACIIDGYDTKAISAPPGFSAEWSYWVSGTCCDIMGFDAPQAAAGPTGDILSTLGSGGTFPNVDNWFGELIALQPQSGSTPSPSPTATGKPTPTPTRSPTPTPTTVETPTTTPITTATATSSGTPGSTPTPSRTPARTPTATATQTATPTRTPTPSGSATPTPSGTPGATPTPEVDTLSVRPRAVDFGALVFGATGATSAPVPVTISNPKGLHRHSIVLFSPPSTTSGAGGSYQIIGGSCVGGTALAPGDSCTIALQFSPTALKGSKGSLTIPYNGNRERQLAIALSGRGVSGRVTYKPRVLLFRKVAVGTQSALQNVVLSNVNPVEIAIKGATIMGKEAGDFAHDASVCGASLGAKASCTIGVTFTPSEKGGRSAVMVVTTGGTPGRIQIPVVGIGE